MTKREARRALAVALASTHPNLFTAKLNLNELAILAVKHGLPGNADYRKVN